VTNPTDRKGVASVFNEAARFCERLYVNSKILEAGADLASD
jgi:hypothetical protein